MPTHKTRDRITAGDRVRISPANGADTFTVTLTDLGAWGMTAQLGARLIFLPWAAVDLVERIEPEPEPKVMRLPDEPEWCEAIVRMVDGSTGSLIEKCDLRLGHEGMHRGTVSGRRFEGGDR